MNLLITGAASDLGRALAQSLKTDHALRLTDHEAFDTDLDFVRSDLGHEEDTDALVAGIETIVHCPRPDGDDAAAWLDLGARRTYNLLTAALDAGVRRVFYISTLDLFLPYDEDMAVDENWRPRPTTEPRLLGLHIGEFVAKEFAHDGALPVACLRLGRLVERPSAPTDLALADAAAAIAACLERFGGEAAPDRRGGRRAWGVFHLQATGPGARFPSDRAWEWLECAPQHPLA